MAKRDFLAVTDLTRDEILRLFDLAKRMKAGGYRETPLARKTLAMIFAKSSTRTRVSFEVGTYQLGGHALFLSSRDIQIGRGEPIPDTARVLSRYVDGIMIRTFDHGEVEQLARHATVPVINGLTDRSHPCQVLADLLTVQEALGGWEGKRVAWVGDGNNMANSWIEAAQVLGFELRLACPEGYEPNRRIFDRAKQGGACIEVTEIPEEAVEGAHVVNTDVWASMGQEGEAQARQNAFRGYTVDAELHQLGIHRVAPEGVLPRLGLPLLAHRRPHVGVHDVHALDRLLGDLRHLDAGPPLLRTVEDPAVGLVALGARQPQLEPQHLRRLDPAVGHVVPVAHPGDPLSLPRAQRLPHREQVGQHLAGVRQVGEPVDDGNRRLARQLLHLGVIEGPDHDAADVAGQHPRGVGDRLAPPQLDVAGRKEQGVPAQLVRPHLEGDPGARARLGEDHRQALARERGLPVGPRLHPPGQVEQAQDVVPSEVGDGEEIALGHGLSWRVSQNDSLRLLILPRGCSGASLRRRRSSRGARAPASRRTRCVSRGGRAARTARPRSAW